MSGRVKIFKVTFNSGMLQLSEREGRLIPNVGVELGEAVPGVWDTPLVDARMEKLCYTPIDAFEAFIEKSRGHRASFMQIAEECDLAIKLASEEIARLTGGPTASAPKPSKKK